MYNGPDSDVQGVPVVPTASGLSKVHHSDLTGLTQPTIREVDAMVAHFKGWKMPSLVVALAETGFVHRAAWSHGETKVTQDELDRANRCLSKHITGQIRMNREYIWFAKTGGSNPVN